MIAQAFSQYKNNDEVIIFASGVSNSGEEQNSEYDREFNLLKSQLPTDKKLIYFSTVSIFDPDYVNKKYISHKLKIESFIAFNFSNYIIFRLPIVVGKTDNSHTFFNYMKDKIIRGEEITIYKNANRYLIDIDEI